MFLNPSEVDSNIELEDKETEFNEPVDPSEIDEQSPSGLEKYPTRTSLYLALSLSLNFLLMDRLIFSGVATFDDLIRMTSPLYANGSIILTLLSAILMGIVIGRLLLTKRKIDTWLLWVQILLAAGLYFGSIGCPVCGNPVLSAIGVQDGLAIFPLGGLELKLFSILLLWASLYNIRRPDVAMEAGINEDGSTKIPEPVSSQSSRFQRIGAAVLPSVTIIAILTLPLLPSSWKLEFENARGVSTTTTSGSIGDDELTKLIQQVIPDDGYEVAVTYGDVGPELLEAGAIDYEQFVDRYEAGGAPLTNLQKEILTEGIDENIVIRPDNAHFLLNFFWALGLTNQNPILDDGPMMSYSEGDIGRFASTGGWTLGQKDSTDLYSSKQIISLNSDQQALVEKVSAVVYRPCCNNPTILPDCNHGMAMLGLLELLAANGSSEGEMMEAAKYFNAYWFPQQLVEVAIYFQSTTGKSFDDVDAELAVGPQIFSGSGFQGVHAWLGDNGLLGESPSQGGSCGV
jgi:hypothetical protein